MRVMVKSLDWKQCEECCDDEYNPADAEVTFPDGSKHWLCNFHLESHRDTCLRCGHARELHDGDGACVLGPGTSACSCVGFVLDWEWDEPAEPL
jgi:hypothetical protein